MFCVRCGREAEVREGLCPDCFVQAHQLAKLPQVVRVEVCFHCGARHKGGSWGDPLPSLAPAIEEEVRSRVEADQRVERWELALEGGEKDPTNYKYEGVVRGSAQGLAFEVRQPLVVTIQKSTCTRCGRRSGGYYESILQLRAEGRRIEDDERDQAGGIIERQMEQLRAAGDLDSFLVRAAKVKGGFDFYFGTVTAGRVLAKVFEAQMGAALKETASLVGRGKDGIDLYRVTFSVKLPRARLGGFAGLDERLYAVAGMAPKTATLVDLAEHRRVTRPRADLERADVLDPGAAREAVVVSESPRELQVLDPDTLRTEDVVKPGGFPPGARSVRVVRWGERLWLLPPDRFT